MRVTAKRFPRSWSLLPILLLGAALRLVGINNLSPPGLEHDEVAHWLINRAILAGQHAIYFTEAYGHEAGFHYLQAAFVALLGDNALVLRLPAAFLGLLGVTVTYALARQLFGSRVAYVSAALLAVLFFPVFYSRLALRAIMLPVLSGLSAIFWWRAWGIQPQGRGDAPGERVRGWLRRLGSPPPPGASFRGGKVSDALLAGLFTGLSVHTYMAARAVPIFYALLMVGLFIFRRQKLRARWREMAIFWLLLIAVAAPLAVYLLTNPGAEVRIGEVDAPLRALRQGDLRPVVDNLVDILGGFGFSGDPLWRQNVAFMPIFGPLLALLFYTCAALALRYLADARYLFLILWVLTATIPSIVTIDAPSSIRMINILPVLTILPAILIHNLGRLSTESDRLSTAPVDNWLVLVLVVALIFLNSARTVRAIFVTWPANDEVRFVWQEALTDAAAYLDGASHIHDVAVAGWTPDTMDPPTMALTLRRDDLALRYFDPQQSLLLPASTIGAPPLIVRPAILPLDAALQAPLRAAAVSEEMRGSFVAYQLQGSPELSPEVAQEETFGAEIAFLGYTAAPACRAQSGAEDCTIITYWRVLQEAAGGRMIFLHVVDEAGQTLATADALGAPSAHWRRGDQILQKHTIAADLLPLNGGLHLGVYEPASGRRLLTAGGQDVVRLQPLQRE